jgi:hypothetical protein
MLLNADTAVVLDNEVAAIEDYEAGPDAFSLVLRGKDPGMRLRVTQSSIEEVGAARRP